MSRAESLRRQAAVVMNGSASLYLRSSRLTDKLETSFKIRSLTSARINFQSSIAISIFGELRANTSTTFASRFSTVGITKGGEGGENFPRIDFIQYRRPSFGTFFSINEMRTVQRRACVIFSDEISDVNSRFTMLEGKAEPSRDCRSHPMRREAQKIKSLGADHEYQTRRQKVDEGRQPHDSIARLITKAAERRTSKWFEFICIEIRRKLFTIEGGRVGKSFLWWSRKRRVGSFEGAEDFISYSNSSIMFSAELDANSLMSL
jgi:hypothetical protein